MAELDCPSTVTRAPWSTSRFVSKTVPEIVPAAVCCESVPVEPGICAGWGVSGRALSGVELRLCCSTAAEHFKLEKVDNNRSDQKRLRPFHNIKLRPSGRLVFLITVRPSAGTRLNFPVAASAPTASETEVAVPANLSRFCPFCAQRCARLL